MYASPETYSVAIAAVKEGGKKVAIVKKSVSKVAPPSSRVSGAAGYDERKASASASDMTPPPLLWPRQDEVMRRFNLNDAGAPVQSIAVINLKLSSVSLEPMLRSMAYISQQLSTPANKVAVINLKAEIQSEPLPKKQRK